MNEIDPSEPSVPLLATFLDPRFKDTKFLNRSQKSLLETSVIYLINSFEYDRDTTATACCQTSSQTHASEPHHLSALDTLLGEDDSAENSRSGDHVSEIVGLIYQLTFLPVNLLYNGGKLVLHITVYLYL